MRELKFRLYNADTKNMHYHELLWGSPAQHGCGWVRCLDTPDGKKVVRGVDKTYQVDPHDCEIMQYTGLTDETGKEIYEGDIVRFLDQDREVEWTDAYGYRLKTPIDVDYALDVNSAALLTVIGNIYETSTEATQ